MEATWLASYPEDEREMAVSLRASEGCDAADNFIAGWDGAERLCEAQLVRYREALRGLVEELEWMADLQDSELSEREVERISKSMLARVLPVLAGEEEGT